MFRHLEENGHARWVMLAAAGLGGCATVDPAPDYARAAAHITAATGAERVYEPGDEAAVGARVEALLAGGLGPEEAVELCLLNNPRLQAAFRSVGMARADRVQAGLLANPSLSAALRFPPGGDPVLESGLFASLFDLFRLPARERAAEHALDGAVLGLAHRAVDLVARTRRAHLDAVAADRAAAIAGENLATARRFAELVETRVAEQAATGIDAGLARTAVLEAEVARDDARLAAVEARRRLLGLLGLDRPPAELPVVAAEAGADELPGVDRLVRVARAHRLDLRAARVAVAEAAAAVERERGRALGRGNVGVVAEGETDDLSVGPGVQLELPVFDRNQAGVARARHRHARSRSLLTAVGLEAVQDVRGAHERARAAAEVATLYTERLLPQHEQALELAREGYRLGRTTVLPVLEAQRSLLAARREAVDRRRRAAAVIAELERATGRPRARWNDPLPDADDEGTEDHPPPDEEMP